MITFQVDTLKFQKHTKDLALAITSVACIKMQMHAFVHVYHVLKESTLLANHC